MLLLHIAYSEEDASARIQFAFGHPYPAACLYIFEIHRKKSHPWLNDDWEYVLGKKRPKATRNGAGGIDLSPSIRDYLGVGSGKKVHWRFVEEGQVPYGRRKARPRKKTAKASKPSGNTWNTSASSWTRSSPRSRSGALAAYGEGCLGSWQNRRT